jgi:hypothetical protein
MRGGSLVAGPGVGAGAAAFFDLLVALGAASAATTGVGAGATGAGATGAGAGAGAAFAGAAAFTTGAATFFAGAATFAGAAAFTAFTGAATFFAGAATFAAAFAGAAFFATFALALALAARRADVLRVELLRALARFDDFARAGLRADFVGRRVRFELAMARAPM